MTDPIETLLQDSDVVAAITWALTFADTQDSEAKS